MTSNGRGLLMFSYTQIGNEEGYFQIPSCNTKKNQLPASHYDWMYRTITIDFLRTKTNIRMINKTL